MSEYQVIARKYRPQCFADVVGQQHVVRTLKNAIVNHRTGHAYLFVGPRGVGKTTIARIFAKALECLNPQEGEPCCVCESCVAIAEDRALDLIEIDAASHSSVGEMRELSEEVMHLPVVGRYKIYIIDEVHMLSKPAWNALLKTVEEPPEHVKFIFATTEVHQVLPTILSRCQRFDLLPIPAKLIAGQLKCIVKEEKVKIDDGAINAIARAADGGMRDAQSLLDQMIAFFAEDKGEPVTEEQVLSLFGLTDNADLLKIIGGILGDRPAEVIKLIHGLSAKGKNLETLYEDILEAVRGVELCQLLDKPEDLLDVDGDTLEHYRRLGGEASAEQVQIILEILTPASRVLHDALNKQIFLESILLRAMREAHAVKLNDVLAKLNELREKGELDFLEKIPGKKKRETVVAPAPEEKIAPRNTPSEDMPTEENLVKAPSSPQEEPGNNASLVNPHPGGDFRENPPATMSEAAARELDDSMLASEKFDEDTVELPNQDGDELEADEAPPQPENLPPEELIASENIEAAEIPPAAKELRRSIIRDEPEVLDQVMEKPAVKEIMDLFGGTIVDIHR